MKFTPKHKKFRVELDKRGFEGAIILSPENFFYLTGLSGHQLSVSRTPGFSLAVISATEQIPIHVTTMDFEEPSFRLNASENYVIQKYDTWVGAGTRDELLGEKVQLQEQRLSSLDVLQKFMKNLNLMNKTVGIEMAFVPVSYYQQLVNLFPEVCFQDISDLLVELRGVKDADEIEIIRTLCSAADQAFFEVSKIAQIGVSERELVECFRSNALASGVCVPSAWSMFSAGANAARLTLPTEKVTLRGEVIKFDAGVNAEFQFYTTDTSRTWVMEGADAKIYSLKDRLYEAQRRMIASAKPGLSFHELFSTGYEYVKEKFPKYVRGHMGHSISLGPATAEEPYISPHNQKKLVSGMILAVEAPFYITGYNGFNIEDMILITDKGAEILTPKTPHYL
jgi:Xaa-Pro aminopeptidase